MNEHLKALHDFLTFLSIVLYKYRIYTYKCQSYILNVFKTCKATGNIVFICQQTCKIELICVYKLICFVLYIIYLYVYFRYITVLVDRFNKYLRVIWQKTEVHCLLNRQ